jgi:hypothetical protein
MHERQAALIGTIAALTFLAAAPARAEKDAATKAQEGEINHWVEYYRKTRKQSQPVVPAEEEREKRKEESKGGRAVLGAQREPREESERPNESRD